MALVIRLYVNETPIGYLGAQRMTGKGPQRPNAVNLYEVTGAVHNEEPRKTTVTHRYGDGPLVLLGKMTAALLAIGVSLDGVNFDLAPGVPGDLAPMTSQRGTTSGGADA